MFFNALLAAMVAVLPDQVPVEQRGMVAGVLGVCLPVASVAGTFLVQLFTGDQRRHVPGPVRRRRGSSSCSSPSPLHDRRLDPVDRPAWSMRQLAGTF